MTCKISLPVAESGGLLSFSIVVLPKDESDKFIDNLFLKKVKKGECLEFPSRDKDGYAISTPLRRTTLRAARAVVEWFYGRLSRGIVVRHRCDNPPCINPAHLVPGTVKENHQDAISRKRAYVGEKNGRSILTEKDVAEIIERRRAGESAKSLALEFKVKIVAIHRAISGRSWRFLQIDRTIPEEVLKESRKKAGRKRKNKKTS